MSRERNKALTQLVDDLDEEFGTADSAVVDSLRNVFPSPPVDTKTPNEWSSLANVTVIDPDGWRIDGKSWDEPIGQAEWLRRCAASTVRLGWGKS